MTPDHILTVSGDDAGARLDTYISKMTTLSRSAAQGLLEDKRVTVNGKEIANTKVNLDVVATLEIPLIDYEGKLRSHEYVVASEKDNSFDSRYFGIVTEDRILGSLHPVLTINPAK